MNDAVACWFVAFPDQETRQGFAERLREGAVDVVCHPSGRPWLMGSWPPEQMVLASQGGRMLAVVGTSSTTPVDLSARLKRVRTVADIESALHGVHGSYHVAASVDGHLYVRGSAFGARRLFRASAGGVTVCADRARTLAHLTEAGLEPARVAARLAAPNLPHPLADATMWAGVEAVEPGRALRVAPDGCAHTVTWWRPPPAHLPMADAAGLLREALQAAVVLRVRPGRVLAADLSGGMDSTSLCFLAAEAGAHLVTSTQHWNSPGNQDHHYARFAADRLFHVEPLIFTSADLPACFTGLDQRREPLEEPSGLLRNRARLCHTADALRARGAGLRLSGHGGDHAVVPPDAYLHTLWRRSPLIALRATNGYKARGRWSLSATARTLLRTRSYPAWLADAATRLYEDPRTNPGPAPWGPRPALPPWASDQAVDLISAALRRAAENTEPLDPDPGRHAWLHQMREAGHGAALLHEASANHGLPTDSPFCDDAVLTACLTVRPHEAGHPWAYKPLLTAAMDGLVPEHILRRTTKDHCGPDWYFGLRTHRRQLADIADTSHLAAIGLVDQELQRRALISPELNIGGAPELENTLGVEAWLRDLASYPDPAHLVPQHPHEEYHVDTATH
ncbi:asparagine synthase-related protein [Streptomyces sp. NBC_01590]|uniref:asparagine synthase-related protein n=1 Tax=Streptomyces sp. NBC_01590 TaxID=2975887 RepID=UPI0038672EE9